MTRNTWASLGRIVHDSSIAQLSAWLLEWGVPAGPVAPLPVQAVARLDSVWDLYRSMLARAARSDNSASAAAQRFPNRVTIPPRHHS